MAAEMSDERLQLLGAIAAHVKEYGYENWDKVKTKFPDVSSSTFWRMVKKVRDGEYTDGEVLAGAVKRARQVARKHLPAPPSPAAIAHGGRKTTAAIDFMGQLGGLIKDVDMLRAWSMSTAADGRETIKNPMYFDRAIKLRMQLLEVGIKAYQEIYDLRRMEDFYNTILDTIADVDPTVRDEILDRLRALNNSRGLTIEAQVVGSE